MELYDLLMSCPKPREYKNDSELAQAYRNWYYGVRGENLPIFRPTYAAPDAGRAEVTSEQVIPPAQVS